MNLNAFIHLFLQIPIVLEHPIWVSTLEQSAMNRLKSHPLWPVNP